MRLRLWRSSSKCLRMLMITVEKYLSCKAWLITLGRKCVLSVTTGRFALVQVATIIAVYAVWGFANIRGVGWGWAGVIWLYSIVTYVPLDFIKFIVRYIQSGKAWDNLIERKVCDYTLVLNPFLVNYVVSVMRDAKLMTKLESSTSEILTSEHCWSISQTAFTRKKDFGKEAREAQWAHAQRTLHGLHPTDANENALPGGSSNRDLGDMAEAAKRRAEIARYV